MGEIEIIKNDGIVTYEAIHDLLYLAHAENREKGIHVRTTEMSSSELQEYIGHDGACFAALDRGKLVGVSAVRIVERKKWFGKMQVADQVLVAVHPEYRGKHISTSLHNEIIGFAKEKGIGAIEVQTQHNNIAMQRACKKWGFRYVDFLALPQLDHYTVSLYKWINGEQPNAFALWEHYHIKKLKTMLRYKPGRIRRI